jgi:hypothetical protein
MTAKTNQDIIREHLLTDLSELSDADFRHFDSLFDMGDHINKYAYPTLKYDFNGSGFIYLLGANNQKYAIGHYTSNAFELNICVPFIFMKRITINKLNSFNISPQREQIISKNLIFLDKMFYYFKGYEIINSIGLKFTDTGILRFGTHFIRYKNTFTVALNNQSLRFDYNYILYEKKGAVEYFIGSIHIQKFRTALENYLSEHTVPLFNKKFSKLTKKELLLLKMCNI